MARRRKYSVAGHVLIFRRGLFFLLFMMTLAHAQDELVLKPDLSQASLSPFLSLCRDASTAMTLDGARRAFEEGRFQKNEDAWPSFGYPRDAIWVRFAVRSEDSERNRRLLELRTSRLDYFDCYLVREDGTTEHLAAGNFQERSPELVRNKFPVIPLTIAAGERVEVFMRVYSQTSVHLPLKIWSPSAYSEIQSPSEALFSSFFGYMAALIILSLLLSLFVRDRGYVIYSLSLIGLVGNYFITSGYYAWLGLPAVRFAVHGGTIVACEWALALMLMYLSYFFNINRDAPRLNRMVVRPLLGLTAAYTLAAMFLPYRTAIRIVLLQALVLGVFAMTISLLFWVKGNSVARFYFMGWLAFWMLLAYSILQFMGLIPMPTLPEYPAIIGMAVGMTLFFIALADRITQVRREALALQVRASEELRAQMSARTEQLRQQEHLIRDLHDGIGGITANIGLMASVAQRSPAAERDSMIAGIAELAAEGSAEIRSLMNTLESKDMFWPDLVVDCRRYSEMMLSAHGIDLNMRAEGDASIPGPGMMHGMSLLRVYKEAIANIVKHSGAKKVDVRMEFLPDLFRMTVADNGKGLPKKATGGRGLSNMRRRMEDMGGRVAEGEGQGTTLVFEVPLPIKPPERGIPA